MKIKDEMAIIRSYFRASSTQPRTVMEQVSYVRYSSKRSNNFMREVLLTPRAFEMV